MAYGYPTFVYTKDNSWLEFDYFKVLLDSHSNRNLFTMKTKSMRLDDDISLFTIATQPIPRELLHRRLGHISEGGMEKLSMHVHGTAMKKQPMRFCETCALTTSVRTAIGNKEISRSYLPFEKVGCDIWSHSTISVRGFYYVIGFTCYRTSYTAVYLMKTKDEETIMADKFLRWVISSNHKVKQMRCDSDPIFRVEAFKETIEEYEVAPTYSAPYTPTQKTIQERQWGILTPYVRGMLHTSQLPPSYWVFAILTACYIHNRTYHRGVDGVPITLVSGVIPDLSSLRIFRCLVYVHVPISQRKKMENTSFKGIFVGYAIDSYGYLIYNPVTCRVVVSRHVKFDETFKGRLSEEGMTVDISRKNHEKVGGQDVMDEEFTSSEDDEIVTYFTSIIPQVQSPMNQRHP